MRVFVSGEKLPERFSFWKDFFAEMSEK